MNKKMKYLMVLLLLVLPLLLMACSGGSSDNGGSKVLQLTPNSVKISIDEQEEFKAVVKDETGKVMNTDVQWVLEDENIGSLSSSSGSTVTFTAEDVGSTKLKVEAEGMIESANIEVTNQSIEITPTSSSLNIGEEQEFEVVVKDGDGEVIDTDVQWVLEDKTIGSLSSTTGNKVTFTAIKGGTTELTASAGGMSASASIDVLEALTGSTGTVTGYVTHGRGGAKVADARVSYGNRSVTTDGEGYFEFTIPADETADLIVEVEGVKRSKAQDVSVSENERLDFEIPVREAFHPDWSVESPQINLNIEAGAELSGEENIIVTTTGDHETYVMYLYLGGEQRLPRDGFAVDSDKLETSIDTTNYPNGDSYLRVLVYDRNENATLYIIPVTINNGVDDSAVPGSIAVMNLVATTNTDSVVFYSLGTLDYTSSTESSTSPSRVSVNVTWSQANNTNGYNVYRSFDGTDYDLIGSVTSPRFDDYSAKLEPNKKVYYKVVPYNSYGAGNATEYSVTPLGSYQIYLEGPTHNATDVSLTPSFTWRDEGVLSNDADISATIKIWDGEGNEVKSEEIGYYYSDLTDGIYEYSPNLELAPGNFYTWDITDYRVYALYRLDATGRSYATSFSHDGSANGEVIFTTITGIDSN